MKGFEVAKMSRLRLIAAICSLIFGLGQPVFGQELIVVALANTQAPDLAPGRNFRNPNFERQSVNAAGQVVFKTVVTNPVADAIFFGYPGALNLVALQGDAAPGTIEDTFCNFDMLNPLPSLIASADGKVAFAARALGPDLLPANCSGLGRVGIWVYENGVGQLLALEGEQAADSPVGVIYSDIRPKFRHSNQGTIFRATLFDTVAEETLGQALMTGIPGAVQRLAVIGDPAAGQPGKDYAGFTTAWPHNNTGQSTFWSWFNAAASDQAIYRGSPASLELLWKSGADASDFIGGYKFMSFGQIQPRDWGLNDAAHACFSSKVFGPNPENPTHDTVWRDLGNSRAVVASTAFSDPGIEGGFEFSAFSDCWINKTGRVLLRGTASSTTVDRKGLWLTNKVGQGDALTFITSVGDTLLSGVEPYVVHFSPAEPSEPHLNRLGNVAFYVNVVNTENDLLQSIWLSNGDSEQLLAHGGQSVLLDNQQQAVLGPFIEFGMDENGSGNQDGNPSAMSDNNQVVFNTTVSVTTGPFTDVILITKGRGSFIFGDSFEDPGFGNP